MPNQEQLLVWIFLVAWDFIEWTVKNQALVKKSQPSHIDLVKEEILAPDYKMKLLYEIEAPDWIELYFLKPW